MACGDHAGAEAAYVEARKRALADPRLTAEYANYVWMLRGDARLGLSAMDTCFNAGGDPGACLLTKVDILRAAGHPGEADALLVQAADALVARRADQDKDRSQRKLVAKRSIIYAHHH
jgi:hypothetical protein